MKEAVAAALGELAKMGPYALALGMTILGIVAVNIYFLKQMRKLYDSSQKMVADAYNKAIQLMEGRA